ncbi:hypothetical protein AAL_04291 [Moelleriella libera RCEF 2490]|uniref:Uncharacterized protein n=1 Tax=Moelleriella libera RCEF 2490 TaxID=1081109 RepID=A0A168C0N4_9HYPO|nr:hypothetical protein AAL_04291 [Moelleriella libera RCEF 2490]
MPYYSTFRPMSLLPSPSAAPLIKALGAGEEGETNFTWLPFDDPHACFQTNSTVPVSWSKSPSGVCRFNFTPRRHSLSHPAAKTLGVRTSPRRDGVPQSLSTGDRRYADQLVHFACYA